MIRNLLSTTASRLIIALINLSIVWLTARFLGAEALGTISLVILGISIIQLVTSILAGSSLVYQASRYPLAELLIIAWIWILISGALVWFILKTLKLIPVEFQIDVLLLSFLGSIITVNQNIFLGKEKVNLFNLIAVLQSVMVLIPLSVFIIFSKWINVTAYITAQYISMGCVAIISLKLIIPPLKTLKLPTVSLVKEAFKFGGYIQAGNFIQLFNYRLSYYIIEKFFDRATLGVFSVGVQIAESIWILGKSMAVLLYSRISNSRDNEYSARLTLNFLKFTGYTTTILILIILVLPEQFFEWIFSKEFNHITEVIASLSIGILSVSISLMFSHYLSGIGKPHYNTIAALIGLIFTLILGFTLIPYLGLTGAGISASVSYLSGTIYQAIIFKKSANVKWKAFIAKKEDFQQVSIEVKNFLTRK
ncbi:MAG: polysaccharide biosynthesis C-terminal domain-containing protein [Omnitrophica WOR_2 bacterium]